MLFNSYTFVLFFGVVLVLHHMPFNERVRKVQLLLASYVFYAAWNPPFVVLLWLSTLVDWFAARGIERSERVGSRRAWLGLSLLTNLGLLSTFKYGQFLLDNFTSAVNAMGVAYQPAESSLILPIGISFYTFQTLSYTIDVYRGNSRTARRFVDYALYVTFFPQLVAGPIVRATDFLPQVRRLPRTTAVDLSWGVMLMIVGMFQKVVLADTFLAPVSDTVFTSAAEAGAAEAWIGALAFTGQIFFDFAGYSTIAVGAAMCLGFALPDNFRSPYAAVGFSDFWRRWHISLSTWLRDYLYIPMGGNRLGIGRTQVNLLMTMLIGGLWHGASWVFVAWGALHGLYLVIERAVSARWGDVSLWQSLPGRVLLGLVTFAAVVVGWVLFRAETFGQAWSMLAAMSGLGSVGSSSLLVDSDRAYVVGIVGLLVAWHWLCRGSSLERMASSSPWWVRSTVAAGMLVLVFLNPEQDRAFIYFQF